MKHQGCCGPVVVAILIACICLLCLGATMKVHANSLPPLRPQIRLPLIMRNHPPSCSMAEPEKGMLILRCNIPLPSSGCFNASINEQTGDYQINGYAAPNGGQCPQQNIDWAVLNNGEGYVFIYEDDLGPVYWNVTTTSTAVWNTTTGEINISGCLREVRVCNDK